MKMVGGILLTLVSTGAIAAGSNLATQDCDFGEVYAFNKATCELTLTNSSDSPIHVADLKAAREGDSVAPAAVVVAPHSKAYVKATVAVGNETGHSRHVFSFRSDETGHENRAVAARGFVLSILDQGRPMVDLGVVNLNADSAARPVELTSHDESGFRIDKIEKTPPYLDVQLNTAGNGISIKMRADAPWGYRGDYIVLHTNSQFQKEVWVGVQSDIHGEVVPASNPFDLGVMRKGSANEQRIRLTSKGGKNFRVGQVSLEAIHGRAIVEPCQPATDGCQILRLKIMDDQPIGSVVGKVQVELPEYSQKLLIAVNGFFLAKETEIEKVDAADLVGRANSKAKSSVGTQEIDIGKAIKNAVQPPDDQPPPGTGPLLKWSVVNEATIHGYQIFRAMHEDGPFVLQNRATIPTKNRDNSGSSYQYRDNDAKSGQTYWYYIGIVYNDGHKQQLTGPQKVTAK